MRDAALGLQHAAESMCTVTQSHPYVRIKSSLSERRALFACGSRGWALLAGV